MLSARATSETIEHFDSSQILAVKWLRSVLFGREWAYCCHSGCRVNESFQPKKVPDRLALGDMKFIKKESLLMLLIFGRRWVAFFCIQRRIFICRIQFLFDSCSLEQGRPALSA